MIIKYFTARYSDQKVHVGPASMMYMAAEPHSLSTTAIMPPEIVHFKFPYIPRYYYTEEVCDVVTRTITFPSDTPPLSGHQSGRRRSSDSRPRRHTPPNVTRHPQTPAPSLRLVLH